MINKLFYASSDIEDIMRREAAELLAVSTADLEGHPDALFVCNPTVIADIEPVVERSSTLPLIGEQIVVIITALDGLSSQGQDKLLKILEDCHYMCIMASDSGVGTILPTIRSRMVQVRGADRRELSALEKVATDNMDISLTGECLSVFEEVVSCMDTGGDLLRVLHLVKEKDSKNFFTNSTKGELICLFNVISSVLVSHIAGYHGVELDNYPSKATGKYSLESLDRATYLIQAAMEKARLSSYRYCEAEFFRDIFHLSNLLNNKKEVRGFGSH